MSAPPATKVSGISATTVTWGRKPKPTPLCCSFSFFFLSFYSFLLSFFLSFPFLRGQSHGIRTFPSQGLNPHHSLHPSHCSDSASSFAHCGTMPTLNPQHKEEALLLLFLDILGTWSFLETHSPGGSRRLQLCFRSDPLGLCLFLSLILFLRPQDAGAPGVHPPSPGLFQPHPAWASLCS